MPSYPALCIKKERKKGKKTWTIIHISIDCSYCLKIGHFRKQKKWQQREKWEKNVAASKDTERLLLKVQNLAKQVSLHFHTPLLSLSSHAGGPHVFTEQEREAERGGGRRWWWWWGGGCLYGKRLWPAWQLCLMDGPPPSGCSACNKYPCSCLTSLTYQTHLSLLGHPKGTHNYALHSPLAGVSGIAALFMGHSPRAKSRKNR